jgi:gas vesicle protein
MSEYNNVVQSNYRTKIDDLKKQLTIVLEDYKKIYVLYNKTPDGNQQSFDTINGNMKNITSSLAKIQTDVDSDISKFNEDLDEINTKIAEEKKKYVSYKNILGDTTYKNNSADIMYNDYKELYTSAYLRNWAMLSGVFLSIFMTLRVFKKQ